MLKNDVELQNFRNAYLRDGRAMVRHVSSRLTAGPMDGMA